MSNHRMYYSQEAEKRAQREKLMLVILVAGVSMSISTIIALLFAPQPGDKTRQQISEQVNEAVTRARKAAENAGERF